MAKTRLLIGALAVGVSTLLLGAAHAEIDPADAVGVWLFDDGSGDVAVDQSGLGNDGALVNAVWTDDGAFGGALVFNGSDACVETGQKLLDGLSDFTVTAWVRPIDMAGSRIGLVGQNDTAEFGFIDAGTINLWTPNGAASIPYGHDQDEWHFVAGVASPDETSAYIDAEAVTTGGAPNRGTSAFNVNIGGCGVWDGTGNWFAGMIDDVSVWHVALEAEDLEVLMEKGLGGALGLLPVDARGKAAMTWADVKRSR